jgi:hypothetical protein
LLLFAVIPFTLIAMKPINDKLMDGQAREAGETETLMKAWARGHWVRTVLSGIAFASYLWVGLS